MQTDKMFKNFFNRILAFFTQRLKKDLAFFYQHFVPDGRFCSSLQTAKQEAIQKQ
jgi:hypothetical protein